MSDMTREQVLRLIADQLEKLGLTRLANMFAVEHNAPRGTHKKQDAAGGGDAETLQGHPASDFIQAGQSVTPAAHAASHQAGGGDVVDADTLDTKHAADFAPSTKGVTNGDSHDHNGGDGAQVPEGGLSLSDVTTGDASISKHGFCPKAPNDTAKFLRGDGAWATPSGGSGGGPFGDGNDGDVTISTTTALTHDMCYGNLTISGTGKLNTAGFRIFVKTKLSIAIGGNINCDGGAGGDGALDGPDGGVGGDAPYSSALALRAVPTGGGQGGSTTGSGTGNGSGAIAPSPTLGGIGIVPLLLLAGGGGGGGGSHGVQSNGVAPLAPAFGPKGGNGGASVGSASVALSGAGGGAGGGVVEIYAKEIDNAGTITAKGGKGGSGAVSGATKSGNGGGGGGGVIVIGYRTASGSGLGTRTATGGVAGSGGNGGSNGSNGYTADTQM